jgi:hypothetical protein
MLSHFDIENTDLSPHGCDCDPEGGRIVGKSQSKGKDQIAASASDSYHTEEPVILRSMSFPEWIIGRWSSAFSSISSSADPYIKDKVKDSDDTARNESMALLSLDDETSYGTTIKSNKSTPVTSVTTAKKQTHQCPNSNSAATTDAGERVTISTQQQQPKKDLLQYESFKDLAPRVGGRYRRSTNHITNLMD